MRFRITKKKLKVIFFWLIILSIAPVFIEVLLVAQLMGSEFALFFFAYYYKEILKVSKEKFHTIKNEIQQAFSILAKTPLGIADNINSHTVFSVAIFVVSGSFMYVLLAWYPLVIYSGLIVNYA